jgi:hypothetical protein
MGSDGGEVAWFELTGFAYRYVADAIEKARKLNAVLETAKC